jgi:hypothetical protein
LEAKGCFFEKRREKKRSAAFICKTAPEIGQSKREKGELIGEKRKRKKRRAKRKTENP